MYLRPMMGWAILLFAWPCISRAQQLVLAPPAAQSIAERPIHVDILVLNDKNEPIDYIPPKDLAGIARFDHSEIDVTLTSIDNEPLTIAPNAFARMKYRLNLEPWRLGTITLRLHDSASSIELILAEPAEQRTAQQRVLDALRPDPNFQTELGLVEYLANRIKPYEPIYFIYGDEDKTAAKFQLSLKYQVFDPNGALARSAPPLGGMYLSYSQTSFWDLAGDSAPFSDNSYRPGILFSYEQLEQFLKNDEGQRLTPQWMHFNFQAALQHESNGRSGDDSRSLNYVYFQPGVTLGNRREWFVTLSPRALVYIGSLSDNPDIKDFRGNLEFHTVIGEGGGIQLAGIGRLGHDWERGSIQLDLSFPIRKLTGNSFEIYLHGQYFKGFGETLIGYDRSTEAFRVGISIVR